MLCRFLAAFALGAAVLMMACGGSPTAPTACSPSVPADQLTRTIGPEGGVITIPVAAGSRCSWTAVPHADFLTIEGRSEAQGNGTVSVRVESNPGDGRTATVTVGEVTVTVNQDGNQSVCKFELSTTSATASGGGQVVRVDVSAPIGCEWTATANDSFLTISSGAGGNGPSSFVITVAPNPGSERAGSVTIAGQMLFVVQAAAGAPAPAPPPPVKGCSFTVSPTEAPASPSGGPIVVNVTAPAGCAWTASTSSSFLTVVAGASGSGSGSVTLDASANPGSTRTGFVSVAGRTVYVSQAGECTFTFTVTPRFTSVPPDGGTVIFSFSAAASGCAWTASAFEASSSFATVVPVSGTGNGSVAVSVSANAGFSRSAAPMIAGQLVSISQATPCPFTASPSTASVPASGGEVVINLTTTNSACKWSVSNPYSWVTIVPSSGVGSGSFTASVAANTEHSRGASFSVSGQSISIIQAGGENCVDRISVPGGEVLLVDMDGGLRTATVDADGGCSWNVTDGSGFVTVVSGGSGTGRGPVSFMVAPNGGGARTTTLVVGTRSLTIEQSGVPPSDGTFVSYKSQSGDWVGGGQSYLYVLSDGLWSSSVTRTTTAGGVNGVRLSVNGPAGSGWWWAVNFAAPVGQVLVPGTYEAAQGYPPLTTGSPSLDFSGTGRSCGSLTGRFVVLEAVYGPGNTVQRFHATFEQHCEGASPALTGEVRVLTDPWR